MEINCSWVECWEEKPTSSFPYMPEMYYLRELKALITSQEAVSTGALPTGLEESQDTSAGTSPPWVVVWIPTQEPRPREKAGTTGFHRITVEITWKRQCISLLILFFHHAPLLESCGDVEVVALRLHHLKDRKGTALLIFAVCSPEL